MVLLLLLLLEMQIPSLSLNLLNLGEIRQDKTVREPLQSIQNMIGHLIETTDTV